jgi:hypothetical protein
VEDREKFKPEPQDVQAHKKNTPVALRGDEAPTDEDGTDDVEAHKKNTPVALRGDEAPTDEDGSDDDVELHRSGNTSSKL